MDDSSSGRQREEEDGVGVDEPSNRTGMGCISLASQSASLCSAPPTSSASHSPDHFPRTLSATNRTAVKTNKDLSSLKLPEPFITQTSPIFRELIGGHATGEIEEEDEQGNRKVHGFIYTQQGKRKTVFRGELLEHKSVLVPKPKPEDLVTVSLPETKRLSGSLRVRTYKLPRIRRREKTASEGQDAIMICKLCATYAQLRLCTDVRDAEPDIPVMCGPCMRMERRGRSTMGEKPSRESGAAVEGTTMPTPRRRFTMKKRPLEVAAGEDQMVLQMLADVQRTPKRVRRVPGRLLEA